MKKSSAEHLVPPTIDDYYSIEEAIMLLGEQPDARRRSLSKRGLGVAIRRYFSDMDFLSWPILTAGAHCIIKNISDDVEFIDINYIEESNNPMTNSTFVNHRYVLTRDHDHLIKFSHKIVAAPRIPPPRNDLSLNDEALQQVDLGGKLLRQDMGEMQELTTGDCGVLYDRLALFER